MTIYFKIIFIFLVLCTNALGFTYKQSSPSLNSDTLGVRGINFNPDGTKMYVTDSQGTETVLQYSLSSAYDVGTASLVSTEDISTDVDLPHAITFSTDGTTMFIMDNKDQDVEVYTLSTAWDSSTSTWSARFDFDKDIDNQPRGLTFNPEGTKMYIIGAQREVIYQYPLSTPWDVSTAGSKTDSPDLTSDESDPRNIQFNSDGTILYVGGSGGDEINKYTLSTAYDVSTASHSSTIHDVSSQSERMRGFIFVDNSTVQSMGYAAKIFITDDIDDSSNPENIVYEYYINSNPTLSSCSPSDGATGVGLNDNIVLTFNEIVDVESGNIVIKKSSDDSIFETIDVTESKVTGSGTTEIIINPSETYDIDTGYYITIASSAFDDVDSGSYAGINDSTTCNFNTGQTNPLLDDKDLVGSIEAQVEMTHRVIKQTTTAVMHRIEWLRRHKNQDNLTNQNIKFQFSEPMLASLSKAIPVNTSQALIDDSLPSDWFLWSEGAISVGETDVGLSSSLKLIDTNGITIGADNRVNPDKIYGVALRFGNDDVNIGSLGTNIDTEAYSLSLYGTLSPNNNNFLDGMLGVSSLESDHIRKNNSNTLTGNRDGKQIYGSVNFGKIFYENDSNFNPTGRIDFGYTELSDYKETGKNALTYDKQEILTAISSIGMIFNKTKKIERGITLKQNSRLEYSTDFSPSSDATLSYVADPATDYTLAVGNEATHNLRAGIGFDFSTDDGFSIIINYERYQKKNSGYTDTMYFTAGWISNRRTQYALSLNGSDNIVTNFNIVKNLNDYNLNFNLQSNILNKNTNQNANISISKLF